MLSDLANLEIDRIVVHEVYRRRDDRTAVEPKLSTDFTNLETEGISTLRERVINVLGNDADCIEMVVKDADKGSVYDLCNGMIGADDARFLAGSSSLARRLAASQLSRAIPGGTLIVFSGTVGADRCPYVAIIKAELHTGFSLEENTDSLLLEYLKSLLLTPHQKLYKIAMFVAKTDATNPATRSPEDYRVLVYDHLIKLSPRSDAAQYFCEGFLGCEYMATSKKLTKDFYTLTGEFISSLDAAGEDKVDLTTYLYSYIKGSASKTIKVAEFAADYLPSKYRDGYTKFMKQRQFPTHAVPKDISYLKNQLKRRDVRFTSDVRITGPAESFSELVDIRERQDGKTIVAISGTVDAG